MTKPKSRIPEFKSIQEEAEFWDTHSFTDYMDAFRPIKVRFAKKLRHRLLLDFDSCQVPNF